MKNIYNLTVLDLDNYLNDINEKPYRTKQILSWLYEKRVESFDEMTNLSKNIIEKLKIDFTLERIEVIKEEHDKDVDKYLFKLFDGNKIESVLMHHDYGFSLCVSSQVGCNMGCTFCESGRLKKVRDLEAHEIIEQILVIEKLKNLKITHIVIMGIGEPFDNFDNIKRFIEIANHYLCLNIGARHITVSTSGIVPKIYEFAQLPYQVNLAISLHAPNDELRSRIMPVNKVYPLKSLIKAVNDYLEVTNRRVTFEYIMLDGINDTPKQARQLCSLLKGMNCYINLIPYNESSNILYKRSKKDTILNFYDIIKKENMNVTIRREFGSNISAACGQLRAKKEE